MKFPGYWVHVRQGKAVLERTTFDETELDPATGWKQAWQNQDAEAPTKGFRELAEALMCAAQALASASEYSLSKSEIDQIGRLEPEWIDDRYEIQYLALLFAGN